MSTPDRKGMLDRGHAVLSIRRRCALLGLARSGVYRLQPANDDADLALLRRLSISRWSALTARRSAS